MREHLFNKTKLIKVGLTIDGPSKSFKPVLEKANHLKEVAGCMEDKLIESSFKKILKASVVVAHRLFSHVLTDIFSPSPQLNSNSPVLWSWLNRHAGL